MTAGAVSDACTEFSDVFRLMIRSAKERAGARLAAQEKVRDAAADA
jgi:hypothetical protein